MAYQAQLLNRLAQFGSVSYDLLVTDDASLLPTYRHAVSLPLAQDTAAKRLALRTAVIAFAANDQTFASRLARLTAMRDSFIDQRAALLVQRDAIQARIDAGDV